MSTKLDKKYEITHEWYENLTKSYELLAKDPRADKLQFDPKEKRLIVEIGIYEGASTVWWSDNFLEHPESKLITMDPFTGSEEHIASPGEYPTLNRIEQIARCNVAKSKQPGRVDIRKGCSWDLYPFLKEELKDGIDILYVDGSHTQNSVMRDVSLFYPHVKSGGAIIFDDYGWETVKVAVDACANTFMELDFGVYCGWQLWTVKR